jgi:hypothetical protein
MQSQNGDSARFAASYSLSAKNNHFLTAFLLAIVNWWRRAPWFSNFSRKDRHCSQPQCGNRPLSAGLINAYFTAKAAFC